LHSMSFHRKPSAVGAVERPPRQGIRSRVLTFDRQLIIL